MYVNRINTLRRLQKGALSPEYSAATDLDFLIENLLLKIKIEWISLQRENDRDVGK